MPKDLTIVIPAYNEAQSIGRIVAHIIDQCSDFIEEIIVVDDGSSDDTAKLANASGARVVQHKTNRGYGAGLKTGIHHTKTKYLMTVDADGQHRTEDIRKLWENRGDSDITIGARQGLIHSNLWRMPGKWVLWAMARYLVQKPIEDLNSGLRLISRDLVMRYMHLCPSGFSFSTTITMVMLSRGYKVNFIPIKVEKREGKSTVKLSTGFDTILLILRLSTMFNPLRIFLPIGFWAIIVGVIWGTYKLMVIADGIPVGSMLAIVTGLLFWGLGIISDQIAQFRIERYELLPPYQSEEVRQFETLKSDNS